MNYPYIISFGIPILLCILLLFYSLVAEDRLRIGHIYLTKVKIRLDQLSWEDHDIEDIYLPGIQIWFEKFQLYRHVLWAATGSAIIMPLGPLVSETQMFYAAGATIIAGGVVAGNMIRERLYLLQAVVEDYEAMLIDAEDINSGEEDNSAEQN